MSGLLFKNLVSDETFWEEDLKRYGQRIFEEQIVPRLNSSHHRHIALVDLLTGDYLITDRLRPGVARMQQRHPDALIWYHRIRVPRDQRTGQYDGQGSAGSPVVIRDDYMPANLQRPIF